ncbi:hypothetical protein COLO4_33765 [Corchorus olitorius]|uniref:Uncharacterized protein n=1 Tax=Corchorus olitorius TaxID=93759 RepID=A0A1R3GRR0_9ROSI|nr:hypothetical protein COLO4_33765 [Corchorus olitorius]
MSSPNDWAQFYHQQNLSGGQDQVSNRSVLFGDQGSADATAVSTTTINSSGAPSSSAPAASSSGGHLSPEGRVGKPVRRRSRASRRTPTTLLNTDTTNFRAMGLERRRRREGSFSCKELGTQGRTWKAEVVAVVGGRRKGLLWREFRHRFRLLETLFSNEN